MRASAVLIADRHALIHSPKLAVRGNYLNRA